MEMNQKHIRSEQVRVLITLIKAGFVRMNVDRSELLDRCEL